MQKLPYSWNVISISLYTLRKKKVQLGTLFVPYWEPSGKRVPRRVLYMFKNLKRFRIITKNDSKEPKKGSKNGSKDSFRTIWRTFKGSTCGTAKEPFFSSKSVCWVILMKSLTEEKERTSPLESGGIPIYRPRVR